MGNLNLRAITGPPIPSAPKRCKAPTVDDIIALAEFIKGRDPAWRHVTAHQHYTLTQKFSPNFKPETLECAKSGSTKHREEIKRTLSFLFDNAPAFPDEVHLMRTARERFERFQRGTVKEFADLPFELRYTLNLFNRAASGPLNDFSVPEQFTSSTRKGLDWAIREGVISQGTDGKIILSEKAKLRLINTVKRNPFPPVVSAHLLTVLRSVNQAVTGKTNSSLELKQLMPRYAEEQAVLLADSYRSIPTSSPLASLKAAPAVSAKEAHRLSVIKDAFDSLERKRNGSFRESREVLTKALSLMATSETAREKKLGKDLLVRLGSLPLVEASGNGTPVCGLSFPFLEKSLPELKNIKYGHDACQDLLIRVINHSIPRSISPGAEREKLRTDSHQATVQSCQREATDVVGTWLKRDTLPPTLQQTLIRTLLSQASPFVAPLNISSALYWIHENRDKLSTEQLSHSIIRLADDWEREKHYHSVFIEAGLLRDRKGPRFMGALEVTVTLLKEQRLTPEDGIKVYQAMQGYIASRRYTEYHDKITGQKEGAERLLGELQGLCGITPKASETSTADAPTKATQKARATLERKARTKKILQGIFDDLSSPVSRSAL